MSDIDISPEAVERLDAALASQIGDDISVIFNHESLFRRSRGMISALSAALTQSRAETAAAYERAAEEIDCCGCNGDCPMPSTCCAVDAKNIRTLATPDQSSALAAIEAAAEARGMRRAAELALQRKGDGTATLDHPYDKGYLAACDACAAAILAMIGEKK